MSEPRPLPDAGLTHVELCRVTELIEAAEAEREDGPERSFAELIASRSRLLTADG